MKGALIVIATLGIALGRAEAEDTIVGESDNGLCGAVQQFFQQWILRDNVPRTVEATIQENTRHKSGTCADQDWNIDLWLPDEYKAVRKSKSGEWVENGDFEIEVMNWNSYIEGKMKSEFPSGTPVTVNGWWVDDDGHDVDGSYISDSKPELHPFRWMRTSSQNKTSAYVPVDCSNRFFPVIQNDPINYTQPVAPEAGSFGYPYSFDRDMSTSEKNRSEGVVFTEKAALDQADLILFGHTPQSVSSLLSTSAVSAIAARTTSAKFTPAAGHVDLNVKTRGNCKPKDLGVVQYKDTSNKTVIGFLSVGVMPYYFGTVTRDPKKIKLLTARANAAFSNGANGDQVLTWTVDAFRNGTGWKYTYWQHDENGTAKETVSAGNQDHFTIPIKYSPSNGFVGGTHDVWVTASTHDPSDDLGARPTGQLGPGSEITRKFGFDKITITVPESTATFVFSDLQTATVTTPAMVSTAGTTLDAAGTKTVQVGYTVAAPVTPVVDAVTVRAYEWIVVPLSAGPTALSAGGVFTSLPSEGTPQSIAVGATVDFGKYKVEHLADGKLKVSFDPPSGALTATDTFSPISFASNLSKFKLIYRFRTSVGEDLFHDAVLNSDSAILWQMRQMRGTQTPEKQRLDELRKGFLALAVLERHGIKLGPNFPDTPAKVDQLVQKVKGKSPSIPEWPSAPYELESKLSSLGKRAFAAQSRVLGGETIPAPDRQLLIDVRGLGRAVMTALPGWKTRGGQRPPP